MPSSSTFPLATAQPLVVEIHRGIMVESEHLVDLVLASADGTIVASCGQTNRPVIPRSAVKAIQALPMITTGAAAAFSVSDDELALASSSHSAEPTHTEAVEAWLHRVGAAVDTLECGADSPLGHQPVGSLTALHNCCSGKHAGFITVARHLGVDPSGYIEPHHPVQQLVTAAMETFTGVPLADAQPGIDGCGIPVFAFPLNTLATATARVGTGAVDDPDLSAAALRLTTAVAARPFLVSGTGRPELVLTDAATEPLLVKGGAEGVMMGSLPQRGLGFALKARDGRDRGASMATELLLLELGVLAATAIDATVRNKVGKEAGHMSARWPES